jgi:mannose-6-phosphate isomerase-like protein (cupin superfamily)
MSTPDHPESDFRNAQREGTPMSSAGPEVLHGGAQRQPIRWVNADVPPMTISRYRVAVGETVSLHVHTGKAEYWVVLTGQGAVSVGAKRIPVQEGDVVVTPPLVAHGLQNTGSEPLEFLNIVQRVGDAAITTTEVP